MTWYLLYVAWSSLFCVVVYVAIYGYGFVIAGAEVLKLFSREAGLVFFNDTIVGMVVFSG